MTVRGVRGAVGSRPMLGKVPQVAVPFWVVKVLTTGMGETTSDFLVHKFDPVVAVGVVFVIFAATMVLQLALSRYHAVAYWFAVVMVAVFGTMAADVLHVGFGVPYAVSTVFYGVCLTAIFVLWYRFERTLSIHSIRTRRRELFYWAAVLATFALGTAAGDLTATTFGLGYFASGVLFAAAICVPLVARRWFGLGSVAAFWSAYVLTRPLGASFADWVGVPPSRGGLDLGTGLVSTVLGLLIAMLVAYLAVTRVDVEAPAVPSRRTTPARSVGLMAEDAG